MGKFDKANTVNKFKEVARASEEKANIIQIKMISTDNLVDYPKNNEDINNTTDLELSMTQNGFTDPLEVTDYGMPEGSFMLVSGHRRRNAGVKVGYTTFPCIIRKFNSQQDLQNYVLLSNAHRSEASDPLLYCKRYKMHEEYLKESNFKGSIREEIAKRLGISVKTADRYNKFNNIILPVWDMVRDEIVGMSSVMPMASRSIEEQEEILSILNECLEQGEKLTRPTCEMIFKGYKEGKKTFVELFQMNITDDPDLTPGAINSQNHITNENIQINNNVSENSNVSETTNISSNDDYKQEFDSHIDINKGKGISVLSDISETTNTSNNVTESNRNDEIEYQGYEKEFEQKVSNKDTQSNNNKTVLSDEEIKILEGEKLNRLLDNLDTTLHNYYAFKDKETAVLMIQTMYKMARTLFEEMEGIASQYELEDKVLKTVVNEMINNLETYK